MENIDIDKPERIIRRHGKPSKKNNKLGIYLYIGVGIIILIALLTAIWLILKKPEIPSSVIDPSRASTLIDSESGIETNLSTRVATDEANGTIPLNFNTTATDSTSTTPLEASSTLGDQIVTNQTEVGYINEPPSATIISDAVRSNLPLDYALAANKLITTTPLPVVNRSISNNQLNTTPVNTRLASDAVGVQSTAIGIDSKPQPNINTIQPEAIKTSELSISQPNVNTIQTANDVQAQLNSAAVQVSPQAQYKEIPVDQSTTQIKPEVVTPKTVNQTVNTKPVDITKNSPVKTQVPMVSNQTKPVQSNTQTPVKTQSANQVNNQPVSRTPQTAVIKNSTVGNQSLPRPRPPDTIKNSSAVHPNKESAVKTQAKQKEQKPVVKTEKPKTAKPVPSAAKPKTPSTPAPRVKINHGNGGKYAIQIASAAKPDGLRKLAVSRDLISARVLEMERNGAKWYVLVNGRYATRQEAQKAISTLPIDIQKNKPWVREVP